MKNISIRLGTREMQIKTTVRFYLTIVINSYCKQKITANAGVDLGEREQTLVGM